jgi:hypothetical protein
MLDPSAIVVLLVDLCLVRDSAFRSDLLRMVRLSGAAPGSKVTIVHASLLLYRKLITASYNKVSTVWRLGVGKEWN